MFMLHMMSVLKMDAVIDLISYKENIRLFVQLSASLKRIYVYQGELE